MEIKGYFYVKTMYSAFSYSELSPFLMLRYDDEKNQYLSQLVLFRLNENEEKLNAGRFERFSPIAYDYAIQFSSIDNIEDMITWIGENVQNKWSWRYKNFPYGFEISFENKIDAGYFALRWR